MGYEPDTATGGANQRFPSTRRSLIIAAGGDRALAGDALQSVALVYWKPSYKYIRLKWKRGNEQAKDLVQGFFAALLEQDILARFDPGLSSFRTYLRVCLDRYVMKQDESANRLKRGGGVITVALDFDSAESELAQAAGPRCQPEDLFHREWQRQIFALAIDDLQAMCAEQGRTRQFGIFGEYDLAEGERPRYGDLAAKYGVPASTVTNDLAWARRELRRLVLDRVASITASAEESRAEARELLQ